MENLLHQIVTGTTNYLKNFIVRKKKNLFYFKGQLLGEMLLLVKLKVKLKQIQKQQKFQDFHIQDFHFTVF